jgi:hypothetical protein
VQFEIRTAKALANQKLPKPMFLNLPGTADPSPPPQIIHFHRLKQRWKEQYFRRAFYSSAEAKKAEYQQHKKEYNPLNSPTA